MDEKALISTAETQLKKFGTFLEDHNQRLSALFETNHELSTSKLQETPYVTVCTRNEEQLPLIKLLDSDRELHKILLTFSYCCTEIKSLLKDAQEKQKKLLFIDEDLLTVLSQTSENQDVQANQQIIYKMSFNIEFLYNVQFLVQRLIICGSNLLHQCGAVLAGAIQQFQLFVIFDYFTELLTCLVIFDEILINSNFRAYWPLYKKTVEALTHNKKKLENCSTAEMNGLQNSLQQLDILFSGNLLQSFLDNAFSLKDLIGPKGMGNLTQQFNVYMKQNLTLIDKSTDNDSNYFEPHPLIRFNVFCVMFHNFCGQVDSKLVKNLLELNAKHPGIVLIATIPWAPTKFLKKHAETLVKSHEKLLQDAKKQSENYTNLGVTILQRDCRAHCLQIAEWTFKMSKCFKDNNSTPKVESFKNLMTVLLSGLRYAGKISFLIKSVINAHIARQIPLPKQSLLSICKLIETLKIINLTYQQYTNVTAKVIQNILQYLQYKVLTFFGVYKKKLTSSKLDDRYVDALAAIKISEKCLIGPPSYVRIMVTKLAIDMTNHENRIIPMDQYNKFKNIMERIEILANFQTKVEEICNTSFMYWHQSLLLTYLKQIIERRVDFNSLEYLICSANSCGKTLEFLELDNLETTKNLKKSNFENIRREIVSKLCAQVETFLRLEVHASLQLDKMSPFEQSINDYRDLIETCPLEINGHYIVLKHHVENYLSSMFYNLTTISLHDWKTYEEMSQLATNRLLLKPIDGFLPNQTLEQGIDILEIMRKIHIFVSKYVYNMNSQVFIEQQSSNKHLDTIGIRHVANSLRTHGTGVINTTVNFAYQFLKQKFFTFSQFLYDEQIKSRLLKELRSYTELKEKETSPLYSYERADAFNKDIKKLGLSTDGQTYMDLFRKVITHVGNTMAYIRLIRSGSMHANYSAALFLPSFNEDLNLSKKCQESLFQDVTIAAAENLECNIKNLCKSFSDSTDYFKVLVDAFEPLFQNPENFHLKNFFLIVPPLTLNFVEHILAAKSKINKKDCNETILFDDGFAVGLAYILKLLNQYGQFNTLQWFSTIRDRFDAEQRKIQQMLEETIKSNTNKKNANASAQNIDNEKLQQTLALTERRIQAHQMEFNLLFYNISSAKIFFH